MAFMMLLYLNNFMCQHFIHELSIQDNKQAIKELLLSKRFSALKLRQTAAEGKVL